MLKLRDSGALDLDELRTWSAVCGFVVFGRRATQGMGRQRAYDPACRISDQTVQQRQHFPVFRLNSSKSRCRTRPLEDHNFSIHPPPSKKRIERTSYTRADENERANRVARLGLWNSLDFLSGLKANIATRCFFNEFGIPVVHGRRRTGL